jgi:hypothetical protein
LATSYTDAENFRKAGANAVCITNGFDESDSNKKTAEEKETNKTFVLSYIGVLSSSEILKIFGRSWMNW